MKLTRRSFIKSLFGVIFYAATPLPAFSSTKVRGITDILILPPMKTPKIDILGQQGFAGWKIALDNGDQYGDVLKLEDSAFSSNSLIGESAEKIKAWIDESMSLTPAASGFIRPSTEDIKTEVMVQLSKIEKTDGKFNYHENHGQVRPL